MKKKIISISMIASMILCGGCSEPTVNETEVPLVTINEVETESSTTVTQAPTETLTPETREELPAATPESGGKIPDKIYDTEAYTPFGTAEQFTCQQERMSIITFSVNLPDDSQEVGRTENESNWHIRYNDGREILLGFVYDEPNKETESSSDDRLTLEKLDALVKTQIEQTIATKGKPSEIQNKVTMGKSQNIGIDNQIMVEIPFRIDVDREDTQDYKGVCYLVNMRTGMFVYLVCANWIEQDNYSHVKDTAKNMAMTFHSVS